MNNNNFDEKVQELIQRFRYARFKHNGRSLEEGIDCLGFIILFYEEFGIKLPDSDGRPIDYRWYLEDPERYVRGIKSLGWKEVDIEELQALDLIYFAVKRNIITHSGIMINDREFIHMSPNRGLSVDSINRHWRKFRGAVRLI
ncbi:C40 family peptidase [Alkaliphilus peptidifermentans]|uniref:NlpC/P60 family protein n=1 Tax=Alkaliphilus peptidifermentans DSM 18978 TaxID=1120976 RepID=A0A1G5LCS3_9FIRM|nr:NlpC/P60 family protein [Alkaliphilus peptidifermentans]SCZ10414.1 NlpC/P60 family protein [Alkaliphilus peptidifermentans DSM 18978]